MSGTTHFVNAASVDDLWEGDLLDVELDGEQVLLARLVRYHRRGKPEAKGYRPLLAKGDAERLKRLAVLLRLAEMLERTRTGRVRGVRVDLGERVRLFLEADGDPWVERLEAENAKLKRLLAEAHLDMHALKSVLGVKR